MPVSDEHRTGAEQEVDVLPARRVADPAAGTFDDHEVCTRVSEAAAGQEGPCLFAQRGDGMGLLFHILPQIGWN